MARLKQELLDKLKEQMGFLRASLDAFYKGDFAESLRIATTIRLLLHESGKSKPLLKQVRPGGLDLQILEIAGEESPGEEGIIRFAVSLRLGPGPKVAPAVDLGSTFYALSSIGAWWGRPVFAFPSRFGTRVVCTRKQVILILANREGGAHVDPEEDPGYVRLLTDQPLTFHCDEVPIETPDLARFLTAQSGVEMLECLKRNFFGDSEVPLRWECGAAPPVAKYLDQISIRRVLVVPAFPSAQIRVTKRE
jgi:hypothetical protein